MSPFFFLSLFLSRSLFFFFLSLSLVDPNELPSSLSSHNILTVSLSSFHFFFFLSSFLLSYLFFPFRTSLSPFKNLSTYLSQINFSFFFHLLFFNKFTILSFYRHPSTCIFLHTCFSTPHILSAPLFTSYLFYTHHLFYTFFFTPEPFSATILFYTSPLLCTPFYISPLIYTRRFFLQLNHFLHPSIFTPHLFSAPLFTSHLFSTRIVFFYSSAIFCTYPFFFTPHLISVLLS
ncbi:unnamed protein product [Acanthosepion pharaonis]|uniref:Uncharacterized protein n=1 Tax=Acanthosepion pharaonis TaxID=158019 RepID=A0A812BV69_ACAPH|nr:unnamed protein product [Sepia pharaonis]